MIKKDPTTSNKMLAASKINYKNVSYVTIGNVLK